MPSCAGVHLIAFLALNGPADAGGGGVPSNPAALNAAFWTDWYTLKQSERWQSLQKSVGLGDKTNQAQQANQTGKETVFSVSLDTPTEAAHFLSDAAAASNGMGVDSAIATDVSMRAPKETLSAATSLVAPDVKQQVQTFTANLSTGIAGLPGIYLNYSAGERPAVPSGFEPVSGGSHGCPGG